MQQQPPPYGVSPGQQPSEPPGGSTNLPYPADNRPGSGQLSQEHIRASLLTAAEEKVGGRGFLTLEPSSPRTLYR